MLRIESLTLREISLDAEGAVPDLLRHRQPSGASCSSSWSDADGVVGVGGVRGRGAPQLQPGDDRHRLARHPRVGGAAGARPADFAGPEEIHPALDVNFRGHHMAKAAVEMGAWELAARSGGDPARRRSSAAPATASAVGISLGIQKSPQALVEKARAALERGYRKVKIKIKPGADVEYVARRARGPGPRGAADGRRQQRLHPGRPPTAWWRSTSSA